jgi:CO/xanthine dehydrogenase Mo-binding subunit
MRLTHTTRRTGSWAAPLLALAFLVLPCAARAVTVEYEPLPAVLDPISALRGDVSVWRTDNVFKRIEIRKGE